MVALAIFTDDGKIFCMGKDARSIVSCVQACTSKEKKDIHHIKDHETTLKYIERAIEAMGGEET
jgi:hypothetical protein